MRETPARRAGLNRRMCISLGPSISTDVPSPKSGAKAAPCVFPLPGGTTRADDVDTRIPGPPESKTIQEIAVVTTAEVERQTEGKRGETKGSYRFNRRAKRVECNVQMLRLHRCLHDNGNVSAAEGSNLFARRYLRAVQKRERGSPRESEGSSQEA